MSFRTVCSAEVWASYLHSAVNEKDRVLLPTGSPPNPPLFYYGIQLTLVANLSEIPPM